MSHLRVTVWIALADLFVAISGVTFGLYGLQRHRNVRLEGKMVARELHVQLAARGIQAEYDARTGAISLSDTLLFDSGRWTLKDPPLLTRLGAALSDVATKSKWTGSFILIVRGHTDAWQPSPSAPFKSN